MTYSEALAVNAIFEKPVKYWCGIKPLIHRFHGAWSDPEIEYKGKLVNEWDVQDYCSDCMLEEGIPDEKFYDELPKWVEENKSSVIGWIESLIDAQEGRL